MKRTSLENQLETYGEASRGLLAISTSPRLKKWAAYSAVAGTAFSASPISEASVIPIDPGAIGPVMTLPSVPFSGFTFDSVDIDLDGDGEDDFWFIGQRRGSIGGFQTLTTGVFDIARLLPAIGVKTTYSANASPVAAKFSYSEPIGGTASFHHHGFFQWGQSNTSSAGILGRFVGAATNTGYVGVQFYMGGVVPVNGWLQIQIESEEGRFGNAGFPNIPVRLSILAGAYETSPGVPILAGSYESIPEPSSLATGSLGLLALGAAGIRNRRKRKRELE